MFSNYIKNRSPYLSKSKKLCNVCASSFAYCYHSINVISLSLVRSRPITACTVLLRELIKMVGYYVIPTLT